MPPAMADSVHPVHGIVHSCPPGPEKQPLGSQPRTRRRNRLITSCLECRRRKLKCDKVQPCCNCTKARRSCLFITSSLDPDAQAKIAEVKEKMGILERRLEQDVVRGRHRRLDSEARSAKQADLPVQEESDEDDDAETQEPDMSHFAVEDAAYYEDDEVDDDLVDLGFAMGRVRITDRIGGLVRPRFSEELAQVLKEVPPYENVRPDLIMDQIPQSWTTPSWDYVAPSSGFFFTLSVERKSLVNYLPSKVLADKLIAHYWEVVHVVARTVHRPSFERQYDRFWMNINSGIEPRNSFQAVVFAALLSSIVSMPDARVLTEFGVEKCDLVDNFREGTEAAFGRADLLRTTKLETLQAFVMYLIALCRNDVSRAHSALTGSCIRLAECMGLHRDPTTYSTSPIEIQVRRLIWYQICFLDIRTCEATGPRPQIRPGDYDTRFPLNIDDVDLDRAERGDTSIDVQEDRPYFTDMTISRMRFECYEMHRYLWTERPKLEKKKVDGERKPTVTSLLARIQTFRAVMEKTYLPMLSKSVPLHALASEMYGIASNRLYIVVLQKFITSDRHRMPDRLRQVMLSASVMVIEHSMAIEKPALATWSWYIGALHQYQVAILIINEWHAVKGDTLVEQRLWKVLDFAFDLPDRISSNDKTRMIMEEMAGKTQIYASRKRWRPPITMRQPGPRMHTSGWQARQKEARDSKEAREVRERSGSILSASSGSDVAQTSTDGISPLQQPQQPYQQPRQRSQPSIQGNCFTGAMPVVSWGSFDPSMPSTNVQHQTSGPELFKFSNFADPTSATTFKQSPLTIEYPGENTGGSSATTNSGGSTETLNEFDLTEVEQLFGSAEMGVGNMLIPPFSFPRFSHNDLQWPAQGRMS